MSAAGGLGGQTPRGDVVAAPDRCERAGDAGDAAPPAARPGRHGPARQRLAIGTLVAVAVLIATMFVLDAWSVSYARRLPAALRRGGRPLHRSGQVGLVSVADRGFSCWRWLRSIPSACRGSRAAFLRPSRCGWASSLPRSRLPSLFATIIKRLIGRARPFVAGNDVWAYEPFTWHARYASLPSGHATTAFAALVAIGAIFPQARALMWIYAVLIALSRVIITAHHPSDVIAGAIVGAVGRVPGAQLVRRPPARICGRIRRFGARDARAERQAHHQSSCPPPALCLEGGMSAETATSPAVSVIVPVRNEAENIAPLVAEIAAALAGRAFEVIYVNDGSTDGTEAELTRLKAQHPWLRQIRHARSCGQSAALRTGMCGGARAGHRHARRRRPERSGVSAEAGRCAGAGRAAHRPRRRTARRAQGHGLQAIPVALRQCRARRDPARRHARHRLRAEGVSARCRPGAALFRRAASLPAGADPARGPRHRLCRCGRPAAPARRIELWILGPAVDRNSRSRAACGG